MNSFTSTSSATPASSYTASPTPVEMPYHVRLAIYNSAGERVRLVFEGEAELQQNSLITSNPSLAAGSGTVSFLFNGALSGTGNGVAWDGLNDNGQLVAGGTYYAKLESQDSFGTVVSLSAEIAVLRAAFEQRLTVYNSAGETVAHVPLGGSLLASRFELPEASKALELDPVTGLPAGGFPVLLIDADGSQIWTLWNGLNSHGLPVAPGIYTMELVSEQPGGRLERQGKQLQLLTAPLALGLGTPFMAPQPYHNGPLTLFFSALPGQDPVRARVYSLAGELVLESSAEGSRGRIEFSRAEILASGVYVAELTWLRGNRVMERRSVKVAVTR